MVEGCRPVLSVDGCFIKGPWKGQILVAIGRDGNNQMFPVAWAVTHRENRETWSWFMKLLASDLDMADGAGWTIISDQQKGLKSCITTLFPKGEHRFCARHVYANLRNKFSGVKYRDIFWRIAKSSTEIDFQRAMKEMQDFDQSAWEFLQKKNPRQWCRVFFNSHAKTDFVDNNMAEIFNGFILEARYKPIVSLLDDIFTSVMLRHGKKHESSNCYEQTICPRILKRLEKAKDMSRYWEPFSNGDSTYSVKHGMEGYVVSLVSRTCTYRSWDLTGIPCHHVVAVMRKSSIKSEDYIHDYYSLELYKKAYAATINPINGQNMWVQSTEEPIQPPTFEETKKGLVLKRRLETGEKRNKKGARYGEVCRKRLKKTCSKCGVPGHNKSTCSEVIKDSRSNQNVSQASTSTHSSMDVIHPFGEVSLSSRPSKLNIRRQQLSTSGTTSECME